MARLARGYVLAISESCALWEDRDLSNSSTERVAVADLARVVEHMTLTMIEVMRNLQINHDLMTLRARRLEAATSILQAVTQEHQNIGPVEASLKVREALLFAGDSGYVTMAWLKAMATALGENPGWSHWVDKVRTLLPYDIEIEENSE